jgi:hypothetical protein
MARTTYRYIATTPGGFIQQLAVSYICRGYHFYSYSVVPSDKDPSAVDAKLIARYGCDASKWTRMRNKRARLDAFGEGRITLSGGMYKSLRIPTPTLVTPVVDFFVRGDRAMISTT